MTGDISLCCERGLSPGEQITDWLLSPQGPYPVPPAPASHESQRLLGLLPRPSQTITIPLDITRRDPPLTSPPATYTFPTDDQGQTFIYQLQSGRSWLGLGLTSKQSSPATASTHQPQSSNILTSYTMHFIAHKLERLENSENSRVMNKKSNSFYDISPAKSSPLLGWSLGGCFINFPSDLPLE